MSSVLLMVIKPEPNEVGLTDEERERVARTHKLRRLEMLAAALRRAEMTLSEAASLARGGTELEADLMFLRRHAARILEEVSGAHIKLTDLSAPVPAS